MLYLSTFLQCKCIFLLEIVVILNKVVIFAVYYYNTRNKLVTLKFATMKTTKKIATEKTLAYATAFLFSNEPTTFMIGKRMYQHVKTVYDRREDGRGNNTLEVVYDFKAMKYVVLLASDEKIGGKEIRIL